jgi:SulP family sulfate permease
VVADGMTGFSHKSNVELVGQGIANMMSVLFGGFAATGAIARTATNIRSGAKTPVAGIIHAITIFACMWWFAPLASHIPLAALAAVLVIVSWNMAEVHHFIRLFKAPKSDVFVLLLTFFLTVLTSLTVAVAVGVIISTLLFIQKISNLTYVKQSGENEAGIDQDKIPQNVTVYELSGPFFFGSADRLKTVLARIQEKPKFIILVMDKVPVIDATGIHALEQFFADCKRTSIELLFCNPAENVARSLKEMGLAQVYATLDEALAKTNP